MKIWGEKTQGSPIRVSIFLAEKGIEVPFEPVDLLAGDHRVATFLAKNPFAQVPVLELDDGMFISETLAICRYFERLHPSPPLFGLGAVDEAIVEMWQRRVEFNVFLPGREVIRHSNPRLKPLEPVQLADWAELNRPRFARGLEILDAQLETHPFVSGDRFTVADITAILAVGRTNRMTGDFKAIARWHEEVLRRPSVISVIGPPADNLVTI